MEPMINFPVSMLLETAESPTRVSELGHVVQQAASLKLEPSIEVTDTLGYEKPKIQTTRKQPPTSYSELGWRALMTVCAIELIRMIAFWFRAICAEIRQGLHCFWRQSSWQNWQNFLKYLTLVFLLASLQQCYADDTHSSYISQGDFIAEDRARHAGIYRELKQKRKAVASSSERAGPSPNPSDIFQAVEKDYPESPFPTVVWRQPDAPAPAPVDVEEIRVEPAPAEDASEDQSDERGRIGDFYDYLYSDPVPGQNVFRTLQATYSNARRALHTTISFTASRLTAQNVAITTGLWLTCCLLYLPYWWWKNRKWRELVASGIEVVNATYPATCCVRYINGQAHPCFQYTDPNTGDFIYIPIQSGVTESDLLEREIAGSPKLGLSKPPKGVVRIMTRECCGREFSGLAFRCNMPGGEFLVTAFHVYRGSEEIYFYGDVQGKTLAIPVKVRPVVTSRSEDFAVLQVENGDIYSRLGIGLLECSTTPETNFHVKVNTYDTKNDRWYSTSGDAQPDEKRIIHYASTEKGSSGSPVIRGNVVVGVHVQASEADHSNEAVSMDMILEIMSFASHYESFQAGGRGKKFRLYDDDDFSVNDFSDRQLTRLDKYDDMYYGGHDSNYGHRYALEPKDLEFVKNGVNYQFIQTDPGYFYRVDNRILPSVKIPNTVLNEPMRFQEALEEPMDVADLLNGISSDGDTCSGDAEELDFRPSPVRVVKPARSLSLVSQSGPTVFEPSVNPSSKRVAKVQEPENSTEPADSTSQSSTKTKKKKKRPKKPETSSKKSKAMETLGVDPTQNATALPTAPPSTEKQKKSPTTPSKPSKKKSSVAIRKPSIRGAEGETERKLSKLLEHLESSMNSIRQEVQDSLLC